VAGRYLVVNFRNIYGCFSSFPTLFSSSFLGVLEIEIDVNYIFRLYK
jgi:hypothetical protein